MSDSNLFQEVQEDLERQRIENLWKSYGLWVIVLALAVVVGTAGFSAYRSVNAQHHQVLTGDYLAAAAQDAKPDVALDALQKFAEANPKTNQADFAWLHAASLAASKNDNAKAVELYQKVAQDKNADPAFQQLGVLLAVQAQMDTGDAATLLAQLEPLTAENGAWRFAAMESQAYLALKMKNNDKALQLFTVLSQDSRVPTGISGRANTMLQSLN